MAAFPNVTHTVGPSSTTFLTWNVKGLNNQVKRKRVFTHMQNFKPDIVFLQETHLCSTEVGKLSHSGFA